MINSLFENFLKIIVRLLTLISGVIFSPIYLWVKLLFPDFDNYLDLINNFLNEYIYNILPFIKQVILNITGIPNGLFVILVNLFLGRFILMGTKKVILFIKNVWAVFRKGSSND